MTVDRRRPFAFQPLSALSHVHFVGIGGAGMSGIAEVLMHLGDEHVRVSGCDRAPSEVTERLESLGIRVHLGHGPEHLDGDGEPVDLVVISSAIAGNTPELARARERGITVVRRAEMLAELMRLKHGIAIAGTHGKTTTTSLVGTLLTEAGRDPTVIVGGRLRVSGTGARLGLSDLMVVEADEFDRSFLRLMPIVAVITNIDVDHLDTYGDLDSILDAFVTFASRVPFFGRVIVCLDDANVQRILPRLADRRIVTYGLTPQADLVAVDVAQRAEGSRFTVRSGAGSDGAAAVTLGEIELPIPGLHNVRNALAAVAVGQAVGLDFPTIAAALRAFTGVHRRFERLGAWRGAAVVDDYAHHPTEVAATLEAARQAFPAASIHAVFQPHLYSRTRDLAADLGRSLLGAEHAVVTDVYASREQPIEGVSGQIVVDAARASGHRRVQYCPSWGDAPALLRDAVRPGDVVLTLGAGDVYKLAESLAAEEAR